MELLRLRAAHGDLLSTARFFAVFESDLRITFDTRVQYDCRDLDIAKTV